MPRPNPSNYDPKPATIRRLLDRAGMSPLRAARAVGMTERSIYYYLDGQRTFPYPVQFILESLPPNRLIAGKKAL